MNFRCYGFNGVLGNYGERRQGHKLAFFYLSSLLFFGTPELNHSVISIFHMVSLLLVSRLSLQMLINYDLYIEHFS
jgi:hypothetical protein